MLQCSLHSSIKITPSYAEIQVCRPKQLFTWEKYSDWKSMDLGVPKISNPKTGFVWKHARLLMIDQRLIIILPMKVMSFSRQDLPAAGVTQSPRYLRSLFSSRWLHSCNSNGLRGTSGGNDGFYMFCHEIWGGGSLHIGISEKTWEAHYMDWKLIFIQVRCAHKMGFRLKTTHLFWPSALLCRQVRRHVASQSTLW